VEGGKNLPWKEKRFLNFLKKSNNKNRKEKAPVKTNHVGGGKRGVVHGSNGVKRRVLLQKERKKSAQQTKGGGRGRTA